MDQTIIFPLKVKGSNINIFFLFISKKMQAVFIEKIKNIFAQNFKQ